MPRRFPPHPLRVPKCPVLVTLKQQPSTFRLENVIRLSRLAVSSTLLFSLSHLYNQLGCKMSVTTSTNKVTQSMLQTLADYDLHHSGNPGTSEAPETRNGTTIERIQLQDWAKNYRRIPAYRSIDRTLNERPNERPAGGNAIEGLFVFTMLSGCRINVNMARFWRSTGGRINDQIFRYDIRRRDIEMSSFASSEVQRSFSSKMNLSASFSRGLHSRHSTSIVLSKLLPIHEHWLRLLKHIEHPRPFTFTHIAPRMIRRSLDGTISPFHYPLLPRIQYQFDLSLQNDPVVETHGPMHR